MCALHPNDLKILMVRIRKARLCPSTVNYIVNASENKGNNFKTVKVRRIVTHLVPT